MRSHSEKLADDLPPTALWAYTVTREDGTVLVNPLIEVRRGQRVAVEWANELEGPMPVTAVSAAEPTGPSAGLPQNKPGYQAGDDVLAPTPPWTVVHLHGGRTAADGDGWTENAVFPGQSQRSFYPNDQRATMLWYHDHGFGITSLNVFAGLAGLWMIRDDDEDRAGLPCDEFEIPLLIQDRNFGSDDGGNTPNGRLLHKVETKLPSDPSASPNPTMEFFGPYTMVNATVWPRCTISPNVYRLRFLNGSNARTYKLALLDDKNNLITNDVFHQVGTDGGLLPAPVSFTDNTLTLSPAERADVIADFRGRPPGSALRLVNVAFAPYDADPTKSNIQNPGAPSLPGRLPRAEVMQFNIDNPAKPQTFDLAKCQLPPLDRWTFASLKGFRPRYLALRELQQSATMMDTLYFTELEETTDPSDAVIQFNNPPANFPAMLRPILPDGLKVICDPKDPSANDPDTRFLRMMFKDRVNFRPSFSKTNTGKPQDVHPEVWTIINLSTDTHPVHLHLVQFQALGRWTIPTSDYDPNNPPAKIPYQFTLGPGTLDPNEQGWKDTIRVNPNDCLSIGVVFDGHTGRYMYHCHILEHEDMEMMRPFVVLPAEINALMDGMAMSRGAGQKGGMPGMGG
jgi:spore coat protein A